MLSCTDEDVAMKMMSVHNCSLENNNKPVKRHSRPTGTGTSHKTSNSST